MTTADLNFFTHIFMYTKHVPQIIFVGLWLFLWLYLMEMPVLGLYIFHPFKPEKDKNFK